MKTAKENLDAINELSNKGYEAARELGELNLRTMEKLVARQMDMMNMFMESSLRQVVMASEAKGYNDLIKNQIEMTKEVTERVMNESREAVKFASDTRDEYRAWMESGMEVVSENLNKVTQATQAV
jgi:phasin family protein